jgi:predicted outer membrane repeat protein
MPNPLDQLRSITVLPLLCFAAGLACTEAGAADRFVAPCGNNAWTGTAQACLGPLGPKRTIQGAIDASVDGDVIYVLAGTYTEAIDLDGKAVHIVGLAGPDSTVLDGDGADHTVTCTSGEDDDTVIEGLRIIGGDSAGVGGGVWINLSSPTFVECQILNNDAAGDGAGVSIALGSPHFEQCLIAGNNAGGSGGGAHIASGNPTFVACEINSNIASTQGGGLHINGGNPHVQSCEIRFNDAQHGGGVAVQSGSPAISSTLIESNEASTSGGGVYIGAGSTTMIGVEITGNFADTSGGGIALAGGALNIADSDILDNVVDSPLEEPTIAHGGGIRAVNASIFGDNLLIDGNEALYGGGVSAKNATIDLADSVVRENDGSKGSGGISGENGSDLNLDHVQVIANTSLVAGGLSVVDSTLVMIGGSIKEHDCTAAAALSVFNSEVDLGVVVIEDNHSVGFAALGVVTIVGTQPGDATFDYCYFLGNTSLAGGAVYLSDGFAEFGDCLFQENGSLSGGAIAADDFVGPATIALRGCTLELNDATVGGGAVYVTQNVSFAAANCVFRWNDAAQTGGAIYATPDDFDLANCSIYENTSEVAAGVFLAGASLGPAGASMTNCLLFENLASDEAGGIYAGNDVELVMTNCTLSNNFATNSGSAIVVNGDHLTVANSIVWGNSGVQVAGAGEPDFRYSIIPAFQDGLNSFTANPLFVDAASGDYRLQAGSPAIEAGSNALVPSDLLDVDADGDTFELMPVDRKGDARVQLTVLRSGGCDGVALVDLGAHELNGAPPPVVIHSADLDGDGFINGADLGQLLATWGACGGGCCLADLNADGQIDGSDLGMLLADWTG